jgi:hypothetical protein
MNKIIDFNKYLKMDQKSPKMKLPFLWRFLIRLYDMFKERQTCINQLIEIADKEKDQNKHDNLYNIINKLIYLEGVVFWWLPRVYKKIELSFDENSGLLKWTLK